MERTKYVTKSTTQLINRVGKDEFLLSLAKDIKYGDIESASIRLDTLERKGNLKWLENYKSQSETLFHLAVKKHNDVSFIRKLAELCPNLIFEKKLKDFFGQTALHISITKGNLALTKILLDVVQQKKNDKMSELLHSLATGSRFVNTVMMGQLPLTVAALVGNTEIVDVLLEYGANLHDQNKEGDTVFHSLVKYAAIYPEKVMTIIQMLQYLNQNLESKYQIDTTIDINSEEDKYRHIHSFVWFMKNKENMTPLQLAAKHGVFELFEVIINIRNVYCFIRENDGLFDVKEYDITEIDNVSIYLTSEEVSERRFASKSEKKKLQVEGVPKRKLHTNNTQCAPCCSNPDSESVLEMLFRKDYDRKDAYRIIELTPVKNIIKMKWDTYKSKFMWFMIFHYIFVIALTFYSVQSGIQTVNGNNATSVFVHVFRWVSFGCGFLYGLIWLRLLWAKFQKKNIICYLTHNMEYITPMVILSLALILDVVWSLIEEHDNIPLIIALICGWWLNVFFLSPCKHFSFFTELIKKVIIGDLFRFGLVILFGLFSFSAGMYIVFRGTGEDDFTSYGSTLMAMFKLGIGINDISVLYSARIPWAAITIFIVFTVFTYLLMLNALIAMMSQTCSIVLEERFPQWHIQQLSIVLLMEDMFFYCCFDSKLACVGTSITSIGYDPMTRTMKEEERFVLEIHSLQMEYATPEDKTCIKRKSAEMQTLYLQSSAQESLLRSQTFTNPLSYNSFPARQSSIYTTGVQASGSLGQSFQPYNRHKSKEGKKRKRLEKLDKMNTNEENEESNKFRPVSPRVRSSKKPTLVSQMGKSFSENGMVTRNQHSPVVDIEPLNCRLNLARLPLDRQNNAKKPSEYEIWNITDSFT